MGFFKLIGTYAHGFFHYYCQKSATWAPKRAVKDSKVSTTYCSNNEHNGDSNCDHGRMPRKSHKKKEHGEEIQQRRTR